MTEKSELELFDLLFPKTDDPPLPMPKFGNVGETPPRELTDITGLTWEDQDLGVKVVFRQEDGVTALITGTRQIQEDRYGVVVGLMTDKKLRFLSRSTKLSLNEHGQWTGKVSFGSIEDVRTSLGDVVVVDVFLMQSVLYS